MTAKDKLTGYAYMKLPGYKKLDEQVLERHSKIVKSDITPKLKEMQSKKEKGAQKASKLLLD